MDRRGGRVERFVGPQEQNIRDHLVALAAITHIGTRQLWKLLVVVESHF